MVSAEVEMYQMQTKGESIFRAFVRLSGKSFAFVSGMRTRAFVWGGGGVEIVAIGYGGVGFGGSGGHRRRIGRTRVVPEGAAGVAGGSAESRGVRRLRSEGPEEQGGRRAG